jgi:hypothetical protein
MPIIIRTEAHALVTTPAIREGVERTLVFFRRVVRMSATVAMTHWPELGSLHAKGRQMALEALLHPTKLRPTVRYGVLGKALGKMPSYLSWAALHAALGAVSSFMSNYNNWLDGEIGQKQKSSSWSVGAFRLGAICMVLEYAGKNEQVSECKLNTAIIFETFRRIVQFEFFVEVLPKRVFSGLDLSLCYGIRRCHLIAKQLEPFQLLAQTLHSLRRSIS